MLPNFTTRTPQTPPAKTENLTTNHTPKQLTVQAKKAKRTAVDMEPESEEDRNNEEDAKTEGADSQTMPSRKTETDDDSESEMYEPDAQTLGEHVAKGSDHQHNLHAVANYFTQTASALARTNDANERAVTLRIENIMKLQEAGQLKRYGHIKRTCNYTPDPLDPDDSDEDCTTKFKVSGIEYLREKDPKFAPFARRKCTKHGAKLRAKRLARHAEEGGGGGGGGKGGGKGRERQRSPSQSSAASSSHSSSSSSSSHRR
jgi:hypothetical protein